MRNHNYCFFLFLTGFSFLFFFIISCGGPKKYIFDVQTRIEKPENISQENFERLLPVITQAGITSSAKVIDKKKGLIMQKQNQQIYQLISELLQGLTLILNTNPIE
jgi:hypothetical protein